MGNIIMSLKEKEQVMVFEQLKRKEISQIVAAQILGISPRWVREKVGWYLIEGVQGLIHKNRGRPSGRKWDKDERDFAINLFRGDFKDFGPTYGSEKLEELHQIKVSKETLRQELIREGLWKAGKKRITYRKYRERKPCFGIMIQLDGSPHDWFEGRGPKCTLLVFIDDATSRLVWLEFATSESFEEYKNRRFQLLKHQKAVIGPKQEIEVHEHLDGSVSLWIRGIRLNFEELKQCLSKIRNAVDFVQKHKDDEMVNQETVKSIGLMSLNEFISSRKKGEMGSRVKRPWPAAEANSHV